MIGRRINEGYINISRDVLTGYNEAFIIDKEKKKKLILEDSKSAEIIRPILRGRDIKRYAYEFADLYIIATFPSLKVNIDIYPSVKQHLMSFGYDRLKQTGDSGARKKTGNKWFETQDSISYWEDFNRQKIVWGEISDKSNFALDNRDQFVVNNKCYLMTGNNLEYLVCFLNSPLSEYLFSKIGTTTGVGTAQWSKFTIEQLPIPIISEDISKKFKFLVSELEGNRITKNYINSYIYQICDLTDEEIAFIDQ